MSNPFEWDFTKLPEAMHGRVVYLIETNQWRELVDIHNQYSLSIVEYCCDVNAVKREYLNALAEGKIKRDVQT